MSEVAIRVENLGKKFLIGHRVEGDLRGSFTSKIRNLMGRSKGQTREEFWALKDVSFDIKKGEAVGIIGRNGAGKSTLLKILSRITHPSTGRFEINGRVSSLLEVGTGFHSELTGRENIYLNGTILGMRRAEIKKKFDAIVDFSGVEKFIDTPVKHYSSGMKVRLAFSVAAHLEPEILIVDEVLAVGDAEFQKKCLGKMDEVSKKEGRTILFVSHNLSAVQSLCNEVLWLHESKTKERGEPGNTISSYLNHLEKERLGSTYSNAILNEWTSVNFFHLTPKTIRTFENIDYGLTISNKQLNKISDLALLIYNQLQQRVGIIDLRDNRLMELSGSKKDISCRGTIQGIGLVSGTYSIGLYISSALTHGNYFNLASFEMRNADHKTIPYPLEHRGYIEFNNQYSID